MPLLRHVVGEADGHGEIENMTNNVLIKAMFEKLNRIRHDFSFSTFSQFSDFRITCVELSHEEQGQLGKLGVFIFREIPSRDNKITYHFGMAGSATIGAFKEPKT